MSYLPPLRRSRFRRLIAQALDEIPEHLWDRVDNVVVLPRMRPTLEELEEVGLGPGETLLGLYVGRPLPTRGTYGEVLPDRIFIYQEPIESICRDEEEVVEQVRETVLHEMAHHFGITDEELDEYEIAPKSSRDGARG